jgi:hypothetical protein
VDRQQFVEQVAVLHRRVERIAQRRLVDQQQADDAEVRQLPRTRPMRRPKVSQSLRAPRVLS